MFYHRNKTESIYQGSVTLRHHQRMRNATIHKFPGPRRMSGGGGGVGGQGGAATSGVNVIVGVSRPCCRLCRTKGPMLFSGTYL